ncbi:MAG: TonB-dependent receptor, partial [Bacteroidota bacterium]
AQPFLAKEFSHPIAEGLSPTKFDLTISGSVRDRQSGESLPFATIRLKNEAHGTTSNADGRFTLFQVPTDTSTILVSYIGYLPEEITLYPQMDLNNLRLELGEQTNTLNEVIVTDNKSAIQSFSANEAVSKISITPAQLASLPSFGEKDIFKSMQLLPGISGTNEASAGLFVRGGTPDQNLILLDGFTVYHVDHFYGFFSAFNANAIKDVQLYKGGFGAKFGGRLSSVMELTGKDGNSQNFSFTGGVSALSVNGLLEVPLFNNKGSLLVAGRRSYTDIIKSGIYNDIFDLYNNDPEETNGGGQLGGGAFGRTATEPSFYYYDLNAKLSVRPTDKDIVSISLYSGRDNLDNSRNEQFGFGGGGGRSSNIEDLTEWGNIGTSLRWGRQWSSRFYSNAVASYSRYFSLRDRFSRVETDKITFNNGTQEDNQILDYTLRIDNEYKLSNEQDITFGIQATNNDISYSYVFNDTINILDRQGNGSTYAAYLSTKRQFLNAVETEIGVRGTYFDGTEEFFAEPRISAIWRPNDRWQIKGAWGHYYQFVNRIVREDVTQGSRDFWLLSDGESTPVGKSIHYILGTSYETENYLFSVEGFYKDLSGLSEYTLRFSRPNQATDDNDLFFNGDGIAKGIEFLAQRKFGVVTGWVGYTLSRVESDFPELNATPYPALHDQTHEIKLVGSWEVGKWTLSSTWVYATGRPYTAPRGGYTLILIDGTEQSFVSVGEKNAYRLPNYHRMDFSATHHFKLGKGNADIGLSVFNVYDRRNTWYKEFEVIDGEGLIETDVNFIGFTPNLFLNIKTFTYDQLNRQVTVTDPNTHTTTWAYDKVSNLTS